MLGALHLVTGGFTHCTPAWDRGWHHQPHHKLYVVQRGAALYAVDGGQGEQRLIPGQLYLIPGGRRQRNRCPSNFAVWWMHLHTDDQQLNAALTALPGIRAWSVRGRPPVWQLLADFFAKRPAASELRLQGLLAGLLADVLGDQPHTADVDGLNSLRARLAPAAAWLDANACSNPSLATSARISGLGPAHFHRLAVEAWGETPHARVQRVRLEQVRQLLSTTELTITAIAERCGFGNPFYLTRAFARRFGEPPSRHRARLSGP